MPCNDFLHAVIRAKYHKAGTNGDTLGRYARIEISDVSDFSTVLKDTGQITLDTPLNDEDILNYILDWAPASAGTYYYRVAFWDDDNKSLAAVWGNSYADVQFPSVLSLGYTNDKDKYTFTTVVNDSYTKPPLTVLTVGNDTVLMDYVSRTGSGPYLYTFSKTVSLERGDYKYHVEVGNAWTVLIDNAKFLHVNYNLNQEPKIEVFIGDRKIKTSIFGS